MSNLPARTHRADERFFAAIENGHPVRVACEASGYARRSVYRWRAEDEAFARLWVDAVMVAADLLEEEADRRGRDGTEEPVFYQGAQVGAKRRFSDALLLARLKALRPAQYRDNAPQPQPAVTIVIRDFLNEAPRVVSPAPAPLIGSKKLD